VLIICHDHYLLICYSVCRLSANLLFSFTFSFSPSDINNLARTFVTFVMFIMAKNDSFLTCNGKSITMFSARNDCTCFYVFSKKEHKQSFACFSQRVIFCGT
jgi:hypothetical protein